MNRLHLCVLFLLPLVLTSTDAQQPTAPAKWDVADDLGIVNAVKNVYRLRKRPTADRIRKIGEAWRPYRSVASWYLWRSLDNE